jgi:hypothetical protein
MNLISLSFVGLLNSTFTYMSAFMSLFQFFVYLILFCFIVYPIQMFQHGAKL